MKIQSNLLSEKVDLAHELQHRVRNNLQLVYGMLNRQIKISKENIDTGGISAIGRRVITLAKVYDHLPGSGFCRTTNSVGYLISLCDSFTEMEHTDYQSITLSCKSELLMLDLETAPSSGLVIAELIANSYLQAFRRWQGP